MENTFGIPIIPDNEEQRLKALYRYEILDTLPERAFDKIADMAAKIFDVPIALVSFVDKERVFFKANVGMPGVNNVDRGISLCSLGVLQSKPIVFKNAINEPCLLSNPLVAGEFGLRFYAGAPLITSSGYNIGTVCIVDKEPREFIEKEIAILSDLASIVMDEIELRLSAISVVKVKTDMLYIAAHDLRNPITNIRSLIELLKEEENLEERKVYSSAISTASNKAINLIDKLTKIVQIENNQLVLELKEVNPADLVSAIIRQNKVRTVSKKQEITLIDKVSTNALLDDVWISEVFENIISNAIKYSEEGKSIVVTIQTSPKELYFEVKDDGLGFNKEDLDKVFKKFGKLSSRPTKGETSSGLGLSIVKSLVELHGGTVEVFSEGKNKGSKVIVKIPNNL